MKKWSNLPNARHIDWVIQSLKDNPDEWNRAWDLVRDRSWIAARGRAYNAARDAGKAAACASAHDAARYDAARYDAAWDLARGAILALIAYDDCNQYLQMTYEELLKKYGDSHF